MIQTPMARFCKAVAVALLLVVGVVTPSFSGENSRLCEPAGATVDQPSEELEKLHPLSEAPTLQEDGWQVSTLDKEGFQIEPIDEMIKDIRSGAYINIDSVLIARHGKLVFEAYFNGFDETKKHETRSMFKSVASTLVGIALDQGLISSVDVRISNFFPDYWPNITRDREAKEKITLDHMLLMSPGFDAEEAFGVGPWRENELWRSSDWIRDSLDFPMAHSPGERFQYSSATTFLLGNIVARAATTSLPEFAKTNLFRPLGITEYCWVLTPKNRAIAMGSFYMRPRDMLKFGQLFLDNGVWQGHQIVSEDWVETATSHLIDALPPHEKSDGASANGYGYQWWTFAARSFEDPRVAHYLASGNGGQKVYVFPKLDMVVVFTGSNYNKSVGHTQPVQILNRSILYSVL